MTPDSERRNSTAQYNPMLISELKENYPRFDWSAYFEGAFTDTSVSVGDDERLIVVQPDYFAALQEMDVDDRILGNNLGLSCHYTKSLTVFH